MDQQNIGNANLGENGYNDPLTLAFSIFCVSGLGNTINDHSF